MFGLHVWILKKRENATPVSGPFGCLWPSPHELHTNLTSFSDVTINTPQGSKLRKKHNQPALHLSMEKPDWKTIVRTRKLTFQKPAFKYQQKLIKELGKSGGKQWIHLQRDTNVKSRCTYADVLQHVHLDFTLVSLCRWTHCFPPLLPSSLINFCWYIHL